MASLPVADADALLHGWLDGELTERQRAEVEAWLREHPEDAVRVQAWAADAEALRAQFAPLLDEPAPERFVQLLAARQPRARPAWQRWAAGIAIFAVGAALGAGWMSRLPSGTVAGNAAPWAERAVAAHALYVPEVRHPVEVDVTGASPDQNLAQEQHLARWLTKRLALPVKLFDLRAQGFELIGGRLLPDASGPGAQLMYQAIAAPATTAASASARLANAAPPLRVTVYLRRPDAAAPAAFRFEQEGRLGMFYWVEGEGAQGGATGYALVGELPRERLLALAEAIYAQGRPPP